MIIMTDEVTAKINATKRDEILQSINKKMSEEIFCQGTHCLTQSIQRLMQNNFQHLAFARVNLKNKKNVNY